MSLSTRPRLVQVLTALGVLGVLVTVGGTLIWLFGARDYTWWQCVFFTLYTVTTVGYAELPHLGEHVGAHIVTSLLIVIGVGVIAFFQSALTATLVEGVIAKAFRRRRMLNRIRDLDAHYVVAGAGRTGRYVIDELLAARNQIVVIDRDESVLTALHEERPTLLYLVGDATEDPSLLAAGVERATGVVACLTDDRDNLFVTLSVRAINATARIVTKVEESQNESKVIRAGADGTVNPNRIGGRRLASELVRPHVTEFLDQMLRVTEGKLRFEEVELPENSPFIGQTLREVPIRTETNLLVVAIRLPTGEYVYNPPPDQKLLTSERLIVIGLTDDVVKLRRLVMPRAGHPPAPGIGL